MTDNRNILIKNIKKIIMDNEKKLVLLYPIYIKEEDVSFEGKTDDAKYASMFFDFISISDKPLKIAIVDAIKSITTNKKVSVGTLMLIQNKLSEIFSRPMPETVEILDKEKFKKKKRTINPDHGWVNFIKEYQKTNGIVFLDTDDDERLIIRLKYHRKHNPGKKLPLSIVKIIKNYEQENNEPLPARIKDELKKIDPGLYNVELTEEKEKPKKKKIQGKKTVLVNKGDPPEPLMGTINIVKKAPKTPSKNIIQTMINQQTSPGIMSRVEKLIEDINKKNISEAAPLDTKEVDQVFKKGSKYIKEKKIIKEKITSIMIEINDVMKKIHIIINELYRNKDSDKLIILKNELKNIINE